MSSRAYGQRSYRRALAAGLIVSFGVHGAVLALGSIDIPVFGERGARDAAPVSLAEKPLEVVRIRQRTETAATPAERLAGLPAPGILNASLASTVPSVIRLLELVEVPEKASVDPVVAYASVEDFLTDARPDPSGLREIDDRSVEVLASIGARRGGGFGVIGGNGCATPGGSLIGPASFTRRY